jgi:ribose transport system permease protein
MSGMPILRAKVLAYVLSGLRAATGGVFLTFFTVSGEASIANGNTYTLYSIAVVLRGVSLFGGRGSTIGDLLFVFDFDPLWQPLFQGVVLSLAVSVGAARLFQARNRLELFG